MNKKSAIEAIERAGALLVFPMDNRKEPPSIWAHFFPRTPMRWEWDENGDGRVGDLWHLRAELSTSRKVVYTKWFRGRATYFSRTLFAALLRGLNGDSAELAVRGLSQPASEILRILESESPLSTKEIKRLGGLQGKSNEAIYEKALKELWSKLLIVAYGEVDDGAFPSLAIGATRVIFEDLWKQAFSLSEGEVEKGITAVLKSESPFYRHYLKVKAASPPHSSGRQVKKPPQVVDFKSLLSKS